MQGVQVISAPKPGEATVVRVSPSTLGDVPRTGAELRALQEKRSTISEQLGAAQNRRNNLAEELKTADPSARSGIQARLKVLDDRLVKLETDLATTGEQIANAPLAIRAQTQQPESVLDKIGDDIVPVTAILSIFVLMPLAFAFARVLWRRALVPAKSGLDGDAHRKLEHLMQAVDTIAVEVERISENQRFVTKVLNERQKDRAIAP